MADMVHTEPNWSFLRRWQKIGKLSVPVALVVVVVDQFTKSLVVHKLSAGPVRVTGFVRFNLSTNSGAAFGLGKGFAPFLVLAGVLAVIALLAGSSQAEGRTSYAALGLILGGAVGNLSDRLLRGNSGAVIDFIDLRWWPTFNLADSAIVCGALLFLLSGLRATDARKSQ